MIRLCLPDSRCRASAILALAFFLAAASQPLAAVTPQLAFGTNQVTASQVTVGGCGVFFGISRQPADWTEVTVPGLAAVVDGDGDGTIAYLPGGTLATKALWAVVDVATGGYTVGAPEPAALVEVTVDPATLLSTRLQLVDQRQSLELLVVRPGVGAWHTRSFDGTASDYDGVDDGQLTVQLQDVLSPVWPPGSKATYSGANVGDVFVGIDPTVLEYWALAVAP